MNIKNRLLFLVMLLSIGGVQAAVGGYNIRLHIEGNSDTMMFIGYYYGKDTYVCDTAYNDGKGNFSFSKGKDLLPGLYFFSNSEGRYVEFVVYHEKVKWSFDTRQSSWMRNMKVKGSKENSLFYDYHRQMNSIYDSLNEAQKEMDSVVFNAYQQKKANELDSLRMAFILEHPQSMIAKMMNSTRDVDVPKVDDEGNPLSNRDRYDYYVRHYFDNIPLDDDMIIRTPKAVFYQHVMDYVDKVLRGAPPSVIIPLLDTIIDRSEPAPEVYRWLVHTLTEKYLQSNIMVYDEVYVHLAKRYYVSGKAYWASPSTINEQAERVEKWEKLLVGKEAPELILFDTLRYAHSLHRQQGRYTLLIFWSPTCGHCREIIPAMYQVFEEYADKVDMTAFTILTEPDEKTLEKWKNFIVEHKMNSPRWLHLSGAEANVDWREVYDVTTTPQIYLIDNKDHTIVAKKLNAEMLREICPQLK